MKMGKRFRLLTAGLSAAAVLTLSAAPAFAAGPAIPEDLKSACKNTFREDDAVAQIKGFQDVFGGSQLQIDGELSIQADASTQISASVSLAADRETLEQSLTGVISAGGLNIDFQESIDDTRLALAVPLLFQTPVSYDFTNDNIEGALAKYAAELTQANAAIRAAREQMLSGTLNADALKEAASAYTDTLMTKLSEISYTGIEGKDCQAGSATVSCDAFRTEVDGAYLSELADIALNTPTTEGGLSILQALNLFGAQVAAQGGTSDFSELETLPEQLAGIGSITYDYYYGGDFLREMDVTIKETPDAEGEMIQVCFAGETIPWHDTIISAPDGQTLELHAVTDGSATTYTVSENGAEAFSFSYDTVSGEYAIVSAGVEVLSGTLARTDAGVHFTAGLQGGSLDLTFSDKAEIQAIKGETIELTKATEEELQQIGEVLSMLGSMAEGSSAGAAADPAA